MAPDQPIQRDLFEHRPEWVEDDVRRGTIATVVLPDGVDKPLDYLVPEELAAAVEPGRRVRVPLGKANRLRLAYCVAVRSGELPQTPLKSVAGVEDERPLLSRRMLELTKWMAERWMARRGEVLEAVLPAGVRLRQQGRHLTAAGGQRRHPGPRTPPPARPGCLAAASGAGHRRAVADGLGSEPGGGELGW